MKKKVKEQYNIADEFRYNDDTTKSYIQNRLIGQIKWYDNKSAKEQKVYKRLSVISIIITATIPIATLLLDFNYLNCFVKILIAVFSSIATILSSINSLYKHRELWIQYRTNCELLKSVLHRYYTKSAEFKSTSDEEAFALLVESCEQYFTKEFDNWNNIYSNNNQSSTGS